MTIRISFSDKTVRVAVEINGAIESAITELPPCPTCEALARTVMLDQTSHDAQRKPLTDEEIAVKRALDNHFTGQRGL